MSGQLGEAATHSIACSHIERLGPFAMAEANPDTTYRRIVSEGGDVIMNALRGTPTASSETRGHEELLVDSEPADTANSTKRYNLVLPTIIFKEVQSLADEEHTTVLEIFRRFVKLGLVVAKILKTPGSKLIVREGDTEREIMFL